MIKLWRKNSLGLGTWRIWNEGAKIYYAHATVEGGAEVVHSDTVTVNNSGRTLEQQVRLEIQSRVNRQLDKGYKQAREVALAGSTNTLGLVNPMLAQPLDKVRLTGAVVGYVQRKYDGHRCLITKQDGQVLAYSRKGKLIETIDHLLADIDKWLPEGMTLDGELYIHNHKLQQLSSYIKRKQAMSANLQYHWYDIVEDRAFDTRYKAMQELATCIQTNKISIVPTYEVNRMSEVYDYFKQFRNEGFEGAMLRRNLRGYEDSKRSDQLIKVKERFDDEVIVISIRPSKDGWAICRVKTKWGMEFDISAPGSIPEKKEVLENADQYIGKELTIEYAGLTDDKIPFHAVAMRWRDDV